MSSSDSLSGKVAIVTGGSRGIGASISQLLAQRGATVVVNYVNSESKANALVQNIIKGGGKAAAIKADVSKSAEVVSLFKQTIEKFGGVDIVVNNAGALLIKPVELTTDEELDNVLNINFKSVVYVTREASKHIRDGGRIVSISSTVTATAFPNFGVYAATKGAVEEVSKSAALELAPKKVTVNVVSPGYTKTDMLPPAFYQVAIDSTPLKRVGEPEEIAELVTFLASARAGWITGQNIRCNGGTQMW